MVTVSMRLMADQILFEKRPASNSAKDSSDIPFNLPPEG
jgi:hypothetical protein